MYTEIQKHRFFKKHAFFICFADFILYNLQIICFDIFCFVQKVENFM